MGKRINAQLREVRTSLNAELARRPRWVAVRQAKFAIRIRELLFGHPARPLGRLLRLSWIRLLSHYTASRSLRYAEVFLVAATYAAELRHEGGEGIVYTEEADASLREALSKRLTVAARVKRQDSPRDRAQYERDLKDGRYIGWVRQWIVGDRDCVLCGANLDEQEPGCEVCAHILGELASRTS